MKKPMTKEIAIQMLNSKEESLHALASLHYPELGKKVNSYEHACEIVGTPAKVSFINLDEKSIAFLKLSVIIKAYNSFYKGEEKFPRYYPVFTRDNSGNAKVLNSVGGWASATHVPAPSLFFNPDDCREAVDTFFDLFKELYSYN